MIDDVAVLVEREDVVASDLGNSPRLRAMGRLGAVAAALFAALILGDSTAVARQTALPSGLHQHG
jgi:hypothetical protein